MPSTTVHIPDDLLRDVDARARAERVSRNRFITFALRRAIEQANTWSPDLLATLRTPLPRGDAEEIDRMLEVIAKSRSSKRSRSL